MHHQDRHGRRGSVGDVRELQRRALRRGIQSAQSLLLASLDQPTRNAFDLPTPSRCATCDAIADQTLKVGTQPSAAFITALKSWLTRTAR
jgi:hypothetical protein